MTSPTRPRRTPSGFTMTNVRSDAIRLFSNPFRWDDLTRVLHSAAPFLSDGADGDAAAALCGLTARHGDPAHKVTLAGSCRTQPTRNPPARVRNRSTVSHVIRTGP